jgi:predicted Zn-dependent peptidase
MKYARNFLIALIASLLVAMSAGGQGPSARKLRVDFKDVTLKNGLRVILVEDHSAPVIATNVAYSVGSRNEQRGHTGFAHFFEHMMFNGSENVGEGEHYYQVVTSGGLLNGITTQDYTVYCNLLPSNQLEMALFLEADRMHRLVVTNKGFENQRRAVQEERRQNVDNQAYGASAELQQSLLYDSFAYKHIPLGTMEDLNAASVKDVAAFYRMYYVPNNAVLVLVGDFNTKDALARIRKYFEAIPRRADPPKVEMIEPDQKAERRTTIHDQFATAARVDIAFKAVPGNTPDFYALEALSAILQGGSSSRLYQRLVKERELATLVTGQMDERCGPGALSIAAMVRPGKKVEDVEAAIYEETERLMREPVADWELQKVKNAERRAFISRIQSSLGRALWIGSYTVSYNDPDLINTWLDKINAVAKEDLLRVAKRYLRPTNRTVIINLPKAPSGQSGATTTK